MEARYTKFWADLGENKARELCGREGVGYDQSEAMAEKDHIALTSTISLYDHLASRRNGPILEVGCGTGRLLEQTARQFPFRQVFGCDICKAAIELACVRRNQTGLGNINLGLMSDPITPCLYNKGFYSNIYMFDVISAIPTMGILERLVMNLRYVLSHEGILVTNVKLGQPIRPYAQRGLRFDKIGDLLDVFKKCGFRSVSLGADTDETGNKTIVRLVAGDPR